MRDSTPERIAADVAALHGAGAAGVVECDVLEVIGPDGGTYLQGQLSQDLSSIGEEGVRSFVLAPTGRVDAWVRVHRTGPESFLLEVDAGWGEALRARLTRFLLRTRAEVSEPRRWSVVQYRWGADAVPTTGSTVGTLRAPALGPGVHGIDVVQAVGPGAAATHAATDVVAPEAIERYRIAHAVPRMGAELTAETIPAEAGAWVIDASVSFTKGCYTGQELVARIDSRGGNVPRPVRLLRLEGDAEVGDPILAADGSECGTVTSATPMLTPDLPALVLAPMARAVAIGESVTVMTGSGPVTGVVVDPGSSR